MGVSALVSGFRPSSLPAALIDISVYKLVFIASGCVLAAGAIVRRAANRGRHGARPEDPRGTLPPADHAAAFEARRQERAKSADAP